MKPDVLEGYECDGQMSLNLEPSVKNKILQAYLKRFGREDLVNIIVVDSGSRQHYPVVTQYTATDMGNPCMVVIVGPPEDLDRGNLEHTDLTDQMAFDFMPVSAELTAEEKPVHPYCGDRKYTDIEEK